MDNIDVASIICDITLDHWSISVLNANWGLIYTANEGVYTIANNIKIAKNCLIGASATILRDTDEGEVYGSGSTEPKDYSALAYFGVKDDKE